MMRVADESLVKCEPLFQGFLDHFDAETTFRHDLFAIFRDEEDLFSDTLRVLCSYSANRCLAVYCLLRNGLVWDAEIVLRSFYETVAKSLFLSTAPGSARENLLDEFWVTLPAVYDLKGAKRAKIAEALARRHGNDGDARVFAGLSNPKNFTVEATGNKRFRNEIEQRWSSSKIVSVIDDGSNGHNRIAHARAMFHNYGIASHLAHASPIAFDLMEDRSLRGSDIGPLERGHIARMLCDMVMLTAFMLHQAQVAILGDMPMASVLSEAFSRMVDIAAPFQEDFQRSQDEFYSRTAPASSDR